MVWRALQREREREGYVVVNGGAVVFTMHKTTTKSDDIADVLSEAGIRMGQSSFRLIAMYAIYTYTLVCKQHFF